MGKQPCNNFQVSQDGVFGDLVPHDCYECGQTVAFCKNCFRDHHFNGYEFCNLNKEKKRDEG